MGEIITSLAWLWGWRLLGGMFATGFVLALAGNLVEGPPVGLWAAIGIGLLFALIPIGAVAFSVIRAAFEFVLLLAFIALALLVRAAYRRWAAWTELRRVEQLMARSYAPRVRSPHR